MEDVLMISGAMIYIVLALIENFIVSIPNMIYFPLAVLGFILILLGYFNKKHERDK